VQSNEIAWIGIVIKNKTDTGRQQDTHPQKEEEEEGKRK